MLRFVAVPSSLCTCQFYSILGCPWACLPVLSQEGVWPTEPYPAPGRVYLQEPLLHLYMSVYQSFVLHLEVSVFKLHMYLCFCAAPWRVCLQWQKSPTQIYYKCKKCEVKILTLGHLSGKVNFENLTCLFHIQWTQNLHYKITEHLNSSGRVWTWAPWKNVKMCINSLTYTVNELAVL